MEDFLDDILFCTAVPIEFCRAMPHPEGKRSSQGRQVGPLRNSQNLGESFPVIVKKNSFGCSIKVVILAGPQCPQEGGEPSQTQKDRDRYKKSQIAHPSTFTVRSSVEAVREAAIEGSLGELALKRMAFATTNNDDTDMVTAATSGVT